MPLISPDKQWEEFLGHLKGCNPIQKRHELYRILRDNKQEIFYELAINELLKLGNLKQPLVDLKFRTQIRNKILGIALASQKGNANYLDSIEIADLIVSIPFSDIRSRLLDELATRGSQQEDFEVWLKILESNVIESELDINNKAQDKIKENVTNKFREIEEAKQRVNNNTLGESEYRNIVAEVEQEIKANLIACVAKIPNFDRFEDFKIYAARTLLEQFVLDSNDLDAIIKHVPSFKTEATNRKESGGIITYDKMNPSSDITALEKFSANIDQKLAFIAGQREITMQSSGSEDCEAEACANIIDSVRELKDYSIHVFSNAKSLQQAVLKIIFEKIYDHFRPDELRLLVNDRAEELLPEFDKMVSARIKKTEAEKVRRFSSKNPFTLSRYYPPNRNDIP